ncbi:MAG: DNA repair protein RadC [Chloroflexota bacterium]
MPEAAPGHRQRLRDKFMKSGLSAFHDYEIVELLLTLSSPRKDCKPQAKEAIRRFKTLRGVLEAPPEELQKINGIGPINAFNIRLVQEVAREFLKEKLTAKPVFQSAQEIFDYLYHSMRDLKKEVFKVIYLNSQNQIIEIKDLFQGTVNASSVSPREVVESALRCNAVSMILVHNHPTGNPAPSQADREITKELVHSAKVMDIKVLDHLIIGDNRYYSFAGDGFIEKCELDYLAFKAKSTGQRLGRQK